MRMTLLRTLRSRVCGRNGFCLNDQLSTRLSDGVGASRLSMADVSRVVGKLLDFVIRLARTAVAPRLRCVGEKPKLRISSSSTLTTQRVWQYRSVASKLAFSSALQLNCAGGFWSA